MSETMECDVKVFSTDDKKAKDDTVTVVLKGEQYISFMTEMGFSVTDQVEFALTVKCGSMAAAKHLGIAVYGGTKKVVLRDRDESLQSFSEERLVPAAVKSREGVLAKYEGIVPEDVLEKIEETVPDDLLQSLA